MQRGGTDTSADTSFITIRSNRAVVSGIKAPTITDTHFKIDLYCYPQNTISSSVFAANVKALQDKVKAIPPGIVDDTWRQANKDVADYMSKYKSSSSLDVNRVLRIVYSKPPTAYRTIANNSTVILCDYIIPTVPVNPDVYFAVLLSGPSVNGPWSGGPWVNLIGADDGGLGTGAPSPSVVQTETAEDVATCVAEKAAADAASKCYGGKNKDYCKFNGTVLGTAIQRTKAGEEAMCYYTQQECGKLKGVWKATTDLFPKGARTDLGECLGGDSSLTYNCRPGAPEPAAAPAPAPAAAAVPVAKAAAAPAAVAAPAILVAASTVPSGPQCANQPGCKVNGVIQGTVVKRTTPGEVPMCFYTERQCNALGGTFAGVSNNLPAGVTGVGECLYKTGGSYTYNCRPGQGGGRRIKRTRKNKKAKKQTRRVRKQRR